MTHAPIHIDLYRWAGAWGPFKVSIPCGECTLTKDIIEDVLKTELSDVNVVINEYDWLSHWWKPLLKGGWHAPIVLIEGKIVSQGVALNRGVLSEVIIRAHVARSQITGNVVFGKDNCGYCTKAKDALKAAGIEYTYFDAVKQPRAVYEMVARTKDEIGLKTPVTTPQIWLDGKYIGGYDALSEHLKKAA